MPLVLLYNVSDEKTKKLKSAISLMGITIKEVEESEICMPLGYIAYPSLFGRNNIIDIENIDISSIDFEFMVFCGFEKSVLDKVLNFMKKKHITVSVKAMMTETNKEWSFRKLISEIDKERKMMQSQNKDRN